MSTPADIRLRPGYDQRYLNIDVAGVEVGHLRLAADGHVVSSWAEHIEESDLVTLVERCYTAALRGFAMAVDLQTRLVHSALRRDRAG